MTDTKVNQVQIGESTTVVFWHGSQTLTVFTAKTKVNLSRDETYKLLAFLQAEIREPLDIHNIENPNTQTYLLAMHDQREREEWETAKFYDVMAEAQ